MLCLGLTSCLKQGEKPTIPGVEGPNLNVQDGKIILSVKLTQLNLPFGVNYPIDKLEHSNVYLGPFIDPNGISSGSLVKATFDLRDVDNDEFEVVPSETLPDGRDFPFTMDGKLPAFALHVPDAKDMTFYASKKVFGFFLPLDLPRDLVFDVPFDIKVNGNKYGVGALIRKNAQGHGDGLIVLLTLDQIRGDSGLQKLMKLSKKNKNKLF